MEMEAYLKEHERIQTTRIRALEAANNNYLEALRAARGRLDSDIVTIENTALAESDANHNAWGKARAAEAAEAVTKANKDAGVYKAGKQKVTGTKGV